MVTRKRPAGRTSLVLAIPNGLLAVVLIGGTAGLVAIRRGNRAQSGQFAEQSALRQADAAALRQAKEAAQPQISGPAQTVIVQGGVLYWAIPDPTGAGHPVLPLPKDSIDRE